MKEFGKSKVQSKINSAMKIQSRWMKLSDEDWDQEIEMLRNMSTDEYIDFIRAEFTATKMLRLALDHPEFARQSVQISAAQRLKQDFYIIFRKGIMHWLKKRSLNLCRFCIC